MIYLITPYDGVEDWVRMQSIDFDQRLTHFSAIDIAPGDRVIGQLDIQQVKVINRKRATYQHITVDLPKDVTDTGVTPELLDSMNAKVNKTYISLAGEGRVAIAKKRIQSGWLTLVRKLSDLERKPIAIWFYTTMSLLCFAWFGDMLAGSHLFQWLPSIFNTEDIGVEVDVVSTLVSFAFYAFFSAQLIRVGKKLVPPIRKIRVTDNKKPKKVLLHTLSHYFVKPMQNQQGEWELTLTSRDKTVTETITFTGDLFKDIEQLEQLEQRKEVSLEWNGTQLMRALRAHIERIELLVLLATRTTRNRAGSHQHAATIKQWLSIYLDPQRCAIQLEKNLLDPINVDDAYQTLNQIITRIVKQTHYSDANLCIDITGATATISCASAMATLHTKAQFQYVTTDGAGNVYQQDLLYVTAPAKVTP
ncbi:CRISPR-associated protein Csx16 [Vibrio mexicanus]|uniref:CRISPR-associated protein Csx16 n=1 Tax=Vibrio mexicanus TaxID=1004326 RepID=UPI00063C4B79|nr:CRISPR-associated protein Csx16 [Vibrio mexicanus]